MSEDDDEGSKRGLPLGPRPHRTRTALETARVEGIFESAAAKLEWANRHMSELDRQSSDYLKANRSFHTHIAPIDGVRMRFNAPIAYHFVSV